MNAPLIDQGNRIICHAGHLVRVLRHEIRRKAPADKPQAMFEVECEECRRYGRTFWTKPESLAVVARKDLKNVREGRFGELHQIPKRRVEPKYLSEEAKYDWIR